MQPGGRGRCGRKRERRAGALVKASPGSGRIQRVLRSIRSRRGSSCADVSLRLSTPDRVGLSFPGEDRNLGGHYLQDG